MSMMGELTFFLGLQIKQSKDGIFINQAKYTKELLKRFDMEASNAFDTPMSSSLKLDKDEKGKDVDIKRYRGMIPVQYAMKTAGPGEGVSGFERLLLGGDYLFGAIPRPLLGMKPGSATVSLGDNCLYRCPTRSSDHHRVIAVHVPLLAVSVLTVRGPGAAVGVAVGSGEGAEALHPIRLELVLEGGARGPGELALAGGLAALPIALVHASVAQRYLSFGTMHMLTASSTAISDAFAPSTLDGSSSRVEDPTNYGIDWETGIYEEQVRSGYRLPLYPFALQMFKHYQMAPEQLVPNGWRELVGLIYLIETSGYKAGPTDFMRVFFEICFVKGVSNCPGLHYIHSRQRLLKRGPKYNKDTSLLVVKINESYLLTRNGMLIKWLAEAESHRRHAFWVNFERLKEKGRKKMPATDMPPVPKRAKIYACGAQMLSRFEMAREVADLEGREKKEAVKQAEEAT
ncbi:hypothetical protein RJ640_007495 [Escallonia rubra]|uniref:Transposase (putative) gypsy type domain-containing protein n=1 Tax=Escallonia rubra TaxID=112253 RepID=A0AA88QXR9_9ASTE|nr:hypothetical protein RJ640_007495 [Escallonia rubra]